MKNKKIKYGKKDLVGGPVGLDEISIRISMMIEGDLLEALKVRASEENLPYQTLMKKMLRDGLKNESLVERVDSLTLMVNEITKRIKKIA